VDKAEHKLVMWWALLIGLTLVALETSIISRSTYAAVAVIILIAMIKVRIVVLEFMEVKHAPLWLRAALELWILAVGVGIVGLTWFPRS
jgi:hypothetical protein